MNLVLIIRVEGSCISSIRADSTAGSHSCLSSGVANTAFHASKSKSPSVAGNSVTTRYTSPDLVDLRCTDAPFAASRRAFPLPFATLFAAAPALFVVPEELSLLEGGSGIRFQFELCVVRCDLKARSASFSALFHDSRKL